MAKTIIKITPNGSIRVEGDFTLVDGEGKEFGLAGRTSVYLCRCGLSKIKPFCDGSHKGHFFDAGTAFDLAPPKS
ncbi:MAG: CDGSH iron-sulfur domain-containing protein [Bacteroidia bacterium]|nr:CDGSH iron-sulfur domain-containing protein [Bacteroidia bacterium]